LKIDRSTAARLESNDGHVLPFRSPTLSDPLSISNDLASDLFAGSETDPGDQQQRTAYKQDRACNGKIDAHRIGEEFGHLGGSPIYCSADPPEQRSRESCRWHIIQSVITDITVPVRHQHARAVQCRTER